MMPRKKKKIVVIISIIILLIIIAITIALLYITTDMFKAKSTLFAKYIGQNVENINNIFNQNQNEQQYKDLLNQNKYTSQTQIKANLVKEVGTTSENTENSVNHLNITINDQTDKTSNYNYKDISLLKDDDKKAEIEYLQNEEVYGLRFKDLFNQYILTNKDDLKNNIEQIGIEKEQLDNIPENIDIETKIKEIIEISNEERQVISTKYSNIINNNVSKDNFSKQANETIEIDGKNIRTNAYILTLTKEQLNNVYIKILEELKQEEIILSRIDKIQEFISKNESGESEDLKEQYKAKIDNIINTINNNNIGQEETKITVYESNKTTVKTVIQGVGYELELEILSDQYMQLTEKEGEEKVNTINYKKDGEKTSINVKSQEGEKTKQYNLDINTKIEENNCNKEIILSYEDDSNKFEINIEQRTNIVDELEDIVELNKKNSINLSDLEEEQKQAIMNEVITGVTEEITNLTNENIINIQDMSDILKTIGIVSENVTIEGGQVTEAQRNRFNSKFEILQGNELEKEKAKEIVDLIKDNLSSYEVVSNTEIRLKIEQNSNENEIGEVIKNFIEENDGMKYNIKVEYDESTGLVNGILLTLIKE